MDYTPAPQQEGRDLVGLCQVVELLLGFLLGHALLDRLVRVQLLRQAPVSLPQKRMHKASPQAGMPWTHLSGARSKTLGKWYGECTADVQSAPPPVCRSPSRKDRDSSQCTQASVPWAPVRDLGGGGGSRACLMSRWSALTVTPSIL